MTRYFLMRCADARLLYVAHKRGVWPVSYGVVDRLNEAFAAGAEVAVAAVAAGRR